MVIRKKVFSESSHCIETHLDVVVEVLEVKISISFLLCIHKEFIEFGGLISCLRFHMPLTFLECPPYNGVDLVVIPPDVYPSPGLSVRRPSLGLV